MWHDSFAVCIWDMFWLEEARSCLSTRYPIRDSGRPRALIMHCLCSSNPANTTVWPKSSHVRTAFQPKIHLAGCAEGTEARIHSQASRWVRLRERFVWLLIDRIPWDFGDAYYGWQDAKDWFYWYGSGVLNLVDRFNYMKKHNHE